MAVDILQSIAGNDPGLRREAAGGLHAVLAAIVADKETLAALSPEQYEDVIDAVNSLAAAIADIGAEDSRPLIQTAADADLINEEIAEPDIATTAFGRIRHRNDIDTWFDVYEKEYACRNDPPAAPPRPAPTTAVDFRPSGPYIAPPKQRRNDPCWCGSGNKYKKCRVHHPDDRLAA